jgi:hypothetical protein
MGKIKKSFKEHSEDNDGIRKRPLKKESRHNYKTHLMDVIESQDWEEFEDELNEQTRIYRR